MNDKFPSDKQDKFMLRLPAGMRDKIAQEAKSNSRSMNAEIVQRLEASFRRSMDDAEVISTMTELSDKALLAIKQRETAADFYRAAAAAASFSLANHLRTLSHKLGEKTDSALSNATAPTFGLDLKDTAAALALMDDAIKRRDQLAREAKVASTKQKPKTDAPAPPAHKKPRTKRG